MLDAGGIDGVAGGEVVGAVQHHVVLGHGGVEERGVGALRHHAHIGAGVDGQDGLAGRDRLGLTHPGLAVGDLALQVGLVHGVVVHQGEPADAGGAQVQRHRRAQATGANHQGAGLQQALLTFDADFTQQDVARVAQQFVVGHRGLGLRCRAR